MTNAVSITVSRRALIITTAIAAAFAVASVVMLAVILTVVSSGQSEADYLRCLDNLGAGSSMNGESYDAFQQRSIESQAVCAR